MPARRGRGHARVKRVVSTDLAQRRVEHDLSIGEWPQPAVLLVRRTEMRQRKSRKGHA